MKSSTRRIIFWSVITGGICLRIFQYFINRSLWLDEASLAMNIIQRDFSGLLLPLDYNQVAPVLFLLVTKIFVSILGPGEYALRLFPLFSSVISLPIFYLLVKKLTDNPLAALISLFIFAFSPSFIYYSSEFKQYSTDILCCLVTGYFLTRYVKGERTTRSLALLGIAVLISIFLSNITIILLIVISLYFLFEFIKNKRIEIPVILTGIFLFASFGFYYFIFIAGHPSEGMMVNYWKDDFMPLNIFSQGFWQWMWKVSERIFRTLINFYNTKTYWLFFYTYFYFLLAIAGVITLIRNKNWFLFIILVFPVLVHLLVSSVHKYPFNTRLILYLYPLIITLISVGLITLSALIKKSVRSGVVPALFIVFTLLILPLVLTGVFPFKREEIKESLSFIEEKISKDQAIYIYHRAYTPFNYYRQVRFKNLDNKVIKGTANITKAPIYAADIDKLSGQVWFLFSHVISIRKGEDEETQFISRLKSEWTLIEQFKAQGSSAYLFERTRAGLEK